MNVLSLFDGISCGRLALERAGIPVTNYYASEIDKYALQIANKNYPANIQLGDVLNIKGSTLPKIDLLIGGSPCQGFSISGKRLNFDDPRSKLFFEFVRLLKECKPKWFLLENVKMKKEWQDIISEHLGVQPIEINSALVSAQNRKRLYWTNIPGIEQPCDKGILLKDILLDKNDPLLEIEVPTQARLNYISRRASKGWVKQIYNTVNTEKAACLTAVCYKTMKEYVYKDIHGYRFLDCIELERLQTLPDRYTEGVSKSQRRKALGNAWTVDVVAHIFSYIII